MTMGAYSWEAHQLTILSEFQIQALKVKYHSLFYITPKILKKSFLRYSEYSMRHLVTLKYLEVTQLFGYNYVTGKFLFLNASGLDSTNMWASTPKDLTSTSQFVFLAVSLPFLPPSPPYKRTKHEKNSTYTAKTVF